METYLLTALGIMVSTLLFLVGYRRTIGAKKERAIHANQAVHRAILRRMVLEDYVPNRNDIRRILEGKAREFRVSVNDLLSEEEVLNSLFTSVFDNDLITPNQRTEIEKRLIVVISEIEGKPSKPSFLEVQELVAESKSGFESSTIIALSASMVGAISTLLYSFIVTNIVNWEWVFSGAGVLIVSLIIIKAIIYMRQQKEEMYVPSRRRAHIVRSELETKICDILEKMDISYKYEPQIGNFHPDFMANIGGETVVIEAMSSARSLSPFVILRTIERLQELISIDAIKRVMLVTDKKLKISGDQISNKNIIVIHIDELANEIKNAA